MAVCLFAVSSVARVFEVRPSWLFRVFFAVSLLIFSWSGISWAQTGRSVTLGWDAPPESDLAGYFLYSGPTSGQYNNKTDVGNVTNYTVNGLVTGTTYYFVVTAYNTSGLESDPSNEVGFTPPALTNLPPTLNALSSLTLNEDAGLRTVALSGITSGASNEVQTLTVTAASSNPSLIPTPTVTYTSPNATGSLAFTPAANLSGVATITVTVSDGQAQTSRSFTVTVSAVNDPPTLNTPANLVIGEDAGQQTVLLSGISSGAGNEAQTLAITAVSSNPSLVATPTVTYTSPNSTGSLALQPAANASGVSTITVRVSDGQALTSRSFTVTVNAVNDAPAISTISNQVILANTTAGPLAFTVADVETSASNLVVSATSTNTVLLPVANIRFGGGGANRTVTLTPATNQTGVTLVSLRVSDGTTITTRTFELRVNSPASQMVYVRKQAESAVLVSPMTTRTNVLYPGTRYIATSTANAGTATFSVNVSVGGTYVIWCRVLAPDGGHDSFFVSVDGGTEDVYDAAHNTWSNNWQWTRVNGRAGGTTPLVLNPRLFTLSAGYHSIRFRGRESNTGLDQILVTNDRNYVPVGANPATVPAITGSAMWAEPTLTAVQTEVSGGVALTWDSEPGAVYAVDYTSNLGESEWTEAASDLVANELTATWTDRSTGERPARFYRIRRIR